MSYQKDKIGFGYNQAALRVECRPGKDPQTKEELLEILDIFHQVGVKAWWYSVSAKGSIPLFKSKVLPYHSNAVDPEQYRWLVEEAHKRGIVLFSWEYLSTAPLLMEEHPDWRMKFTECNEGFPERDKQFACYLSPYGDLLKKFCVEVVNELESKYDICVNVTAVMSAQQCFLAALAGATYVSLFGGRVNNMGYNCVTELRKTRELLDAHDLKAKLIAGSTREVLNVVEWLLAGAHIVTATPDIIEGMIIHPYSKETVQMFLSDAARLTSSPNVTKQEDT